MEKLNKKSVSPPPLSVLRRPAPAPYFHPLFSVFQTPFPGEVVKIYFPQLKKKGKSEIWGLSIDVQKQIQGDGISLLGPKTWSKLDCSNKNVKTRTSFLHAKKMNTLIHLQIQNNSNDNHSIMIDVTIHLSISIIYFVIINMGTQWK